jgi:hypothetical protein
VVGPFLSSDTSSLFRAFLWPWVLEIKILFPLKTLRSHASIQRKKLENRISHEGAMSFFWWSLVVVGPFLSSDTSSVFWAFLWPWVLEFKISLSIENLALLRFDSSYKNRKSDIAPGSYELFLVKPGRGRSVPQFRHIFTFSGVSLALSSGIQIFTFHWKPRALTLRFNLKNSKIGYGTRELWAFCGEASSLLVRSSVQTHLHFFGRLSCSEF